MAGSRVEKIGTIFSRVQGLMRTGAMKHADRPLWYDVYEAFPPSRDPVYLKHPVHPDPVNILYKEDVLRVKFYDIYGTPDLVDLRDKSTQTICQKFVKKCEELSREGLVGDSLFDAAASALKNEGIRLKTVDEIRKEREERYRQAAKERLAKSLEKSKRTSLSVSDIFGDNMNESSQAEDTLDETILEDRESGNNDNKKR